MLRGKHKKLVEGDQTNEWRKSGSFVNKPQRGWLHPDSAIMGPGVVYKVQYLGNIEVTQSMRTLEFDMRTQATKEAIWRVLDRTGVSPRPPAATRSSRKKASKDITKILGDRPNLQFSQSFIHLTISTASLTLVVSNTGQFIAHHQMQSISFASGGDPDTIDYVAYVAKDPKNNRACHVLKCADGLAQDVINTVGQAFELRFKEYLKNPPKAVTPPDRTEPLFHEGTSRWGDDEPEYYNELPSSSTSNKNTPSVPDSGFQMVRDGETCFPKFDDVTLTSQQQGKTQDYVNNEIKVQPSTTNDIHSNGMQQQPPPQPTSNNMPIPARRGGPVPKNFEDHNYVNTNLHASGDAQAAMLPTTIAPPPNHHFNMTSQPAMTSPPTSPLKQHLPSSSGGGGGGGVLAMAAAMGLSSPPPSTNPAAVPYYPNKKQQIQSNSSSVGDAFDMRPITSVLNQPSPSNSPRQAQFHAPPPPPTTSQQTPMASSSTSQPIDRLQSEPWFHGSVSRKEAEQLLSHDGDFLVRESSSSKGQYVLSGVKDQQYKHLLLVDPSGVVRTKDRQFESVSHLISFHRDNDLPIVSSGSVLLLRQPVHRQIER